MSIEALCSTFSIEERRVRLLGDSFGPLEPLFASRPAKKRGDFDSAEVAKARLEAILEGSVLPLMPWSIPVLLSRASR